MTLIQHVQRADALTAPVATAVIAAGVMPSVRVGQSIRVPVKMLNEWIEQQLAQNATR